MAIVVVVVRFTLVQANDAILGPAPNLSTQVHVLIISLPFANEVFGFIAIITSTLGNRGFKLGFA
jgi:hypothetical protein